MTHRIKKKLLYKFLVFFLPFIIFSITITGLVLSLTSYNFFQKTIAEDYRNIIKGSIGEIRLFMDNARSNMESLALLMTATRLDDWGREMALTAFLHKNTQFMSLSLLTVEGRPAATTLLEAPAMRYHDDPLFDRALGGQTGISGVMMAREQIPVVHLTVPVFSRGKVVNVLWAELNLKSIWDILEGIRIGKSGQVYLMDLSGRTIAHKEFDRVIKPPTELNETIIASLKNAADPVKWFEVKNGTRFFNLGAHLSRLDWIVVLSQPSREIYTYLYRSIFWGVLSILGFCGIAIFFAWNWIRKLLKPIASLHEQVRIIGEGDLDQKVSIDSEDEIGDLGQAFNEMTDSLREYIHREVETAKELVHAKNLAVLGTASSKVTHEVGNFLNNTDMALSGLKRESLSERGQKILRILDNESGRVKVFIRRFLQFAKKPELKLTRRPLGPIIRDVLDIYQESAAERDIHLDFEWPESIPPVNVDVGMFSQVLHNLLKNSLDALSEAGEIRVSGGLSRTSLVLTITDSGKGMDPETRERMFDPFFTTKGTEGTGLGMPIVKTIIASHRGTIDCHSSVNQGTSFVIHLPLD
jgi:signal transduction histidine kinase